MKLALVLAGVVLAVFLVDRLLLWMEWRGWIDYRRTYPGRMNAGQVGPAFLSIQGLLEPDKKHAAEEQTRLRTERDAQGRGGGDDDEPGRPRGRSSEVESSTTLDTWSSGHTPHSRSEIGVALRR